jgi:hypothetical protein
LHAFDVARATADTNPDNEALMDNSNFPENDPRHHTANIKRMLDDTAQHAREDVEKVQDPKAKALFETTAEVLGGLRKAYDDFERKNEGAWR